MKEHERLKAICDKIGYDHESEWITFKDNCYMLQSLLQETEIILNVREIIFTPEFKEKFEQYHYWENEWTLYGFDGVLEHLHDPVSYLYNILEL